MAALKTFAVALALVATAPGHAQAVERWRPHIEEASARFGVPVAWIERVMRAESGGQTMLAGRPIVSHAGAMGLMQLVPGTWAAIRARLGLGFDPHAPRDNILAGTFYLRLMHDRFGYPGLFAAYNAGPGRYADYLAGKRGLPSETRAYLAEVTGGGTLAVRRRLEPVPDSPSMARPIFYALRQMPASPSGQPVKPPGLFMLARGVGDDRAIR